MLEFALEHRKALDKITDRTKLGLSKYNMNDEEWEIARQLRDVLKVILKHATLFFSRSTPNLAMVIPAMDHIDTTFTQGIIKKGANKTDTLSPAIRAALGLAKKTLNRYYSKTDASEVYRIAMILHPSHKLEYFKQAGWEDHWVQTAETMVRDQYKNSYESFPGARDAPDSKAPEDSVC
ncbi:hypothetical protein BJ138DRAFT_1020640 [Hygrophoropsis aurantiaca]|uniref:Uncharacterized protein n=1 Tax=Hygrophoropsis aurantiaca TaxID=72124 RepID=A0ACB7ZQS4_9AGAM|nr:hypothetical protein BJ138DRAFT_1020640 [Hygrophoropsis aurantiaca]